MANKFNFDTPFIDYKKYKDNNLKNDINNLFKGLKKTGKNIASNGGVLSFIGKETLNAIQGLADWFGMGNSFKRLITGQDITEADIINLIDQMTNKALNSAQSKADEYYDKLMNISSMQSSPTIKNAITNAYNRINKLMKKTKDSIADATVLIDSAKLQGQDFISKRAGDAINAEPEFTKTAQKAKEILNNVSKIEEKLS